MTIFYFIYYINNIIHRYYPIKFPHIKFYNMKSISKLFSDIRKDEILEYTFPYYLNSIIYITAFISCKYENPFIQIWIVFGLLPLLDMYLKHDEVNPTRQQVNIIKNQFRYKVPILSSILFDWMFLIWGINDIAYGNHGYLYNSSVFFLISIMQVTSMTLSHEIFHKPALWEKLLGTFNMSKNLYMHFLIEHLEGHHKNVATPEDPATSQLNETLYEFLPRTIIGSFKSAWKIENKNCMEKYKTKYSIYNRMIYFTASYIIIPVSVYAMFGVKVLALFMGVALSSIVYTEAINYIEHYGLQRKKLEDGSYENVSILHSWNAPHRITNYMLFKLQRHSDHHENSRKTYQTLCTYEESPMFPNGYSACFLLAFFPKIWFKAMNPLVSAYKTGKPTKEMMKSVNDVVKKFVLSLNMMILVLGFCQASI